MLDGQTGNLTDEESQLVEADMSFIKRKGIYPYEYMDSFDKFSEEQIPPIEAFASSLTGETISEEDYEHAKNMLISGKMFSCFSVR